MITREPLGQHLYVFVVREEVRVKVNKADSEWQTER